MAERHGLLVVNGYAGKGASEKVADAIKLQTPVESVLFHEFIALPAAQQQEALSLFTDLFVLGGDGSTFTMLQLLHSLYQEQQKAENGVSPITVTALGLGGENVVAKHMNTHDNKEDVVRRVLAGEFSPVPVFPSQLVTPSAVHPFFWNVHAGFSAGVLEKIEEMRAAGYGDWMRRYLGSFLEMMQMHVHQPVEYQINGVDQASVLDFGVITTLFPFWTSKIRLAPQVIAPAMLHTIAKPSDLDMSKPVFSARFILEMIALQQGFGYERKIINHRPIKSSDVISVQSNSEGSLAIDSEPTSATVGEITLFDSSTKFASVQLAQLED